jgi:hypothetical protein
MARPIVSIIFAKGHARSRAVDRRGGRHDDAPDPFLAGTFQNVRGAAYVHLLVQAQVLKGLSPAARPGRHPGSSSRVVIP